MEGGFVLIRSDGEQTVRWAHLTEIAAYRRDPTGEDILCLAFRVAPTGEVLEITEETPGYLELLEEMYRAFPHISRTWWQEVAAGLGPNRVTLHGRAMEEEPEDASPAERYLRKIPRRKGRLWDWRFEKVLLGAGMLTAAAVQSFLLGSLTGGTFPAGGGILPVLLAVLAASRLRRPAALFLLLAGFHFAEALLGMVTGRFGLSLAGRLFARQFSFLLLPGLEILLGLGTMLLRQRKRQKRR